MDEQKLVKLLKEHFPSKADHEALRSEVVGLRDEMREGFEEVKESIEDLKASSRALDKILEEHPNPSD
ncbi:MAG: hypothetical protein Q7R75_00195 [bacterium]|nr:hypothetical protein [bacterium]